MSFLQAKNNMFHNFLFYKCSLNKVSQMKPFMTPLKKDLNDCCFFEKDTFIVVCLRLALKVHKHDIFYVTFFAETETLWSKGPVTRDF